MWTPTEIPDPREAPEEYASAVEENLLSVLRVTSGATMVLCTSYDMVRRLTVAVGRERPDLRVFSQEASTGAGALLKKFRRARNAVLIGTSSFWQGVDLPGESLICVVITRLPFEVPDNPMVEARCDWIEKNGGNPFFEYSLPNAVLMFRQGFGRLIRTRKDWGVFAVLDPRLKTRRYGRTFVRSLPNLFQTDDLQAVAAFVAYHRNRTNPQDDGN
jgi:ATP-dependent DNA helicase DinG